MRRPTSNHTDCTAADLGPKGWGMREGDFMITSSSLSKLRRSQMRYWAGTQAILATHGVLAVT